jgi:xanthine/CO dehydrogenase XdhC/CoxF family maturation factor
MVVGPNGEVVGSVSGGCVESAVYELSRQAATTGRPALVRYGISAGDPYAPELTCGGSLDVFASQVSAETFPGLDAVAQDVQAGRPVAVATIVEHTLTPPPSGDASSYGPSQAGLSRPSPYPPDLARRTRKRSSIR